jgi:hypothetical protein
LSCAPPQMPGLLCAVIQLSSSMGLRYSCNSKEPKRAKPRMSGRNLLCVLTLFIHRCTLFHAIQTMYSQSCAARTVHCASMGYPDEVACSMSFRHCCYQFLCVPALPSPGMEHAPPVAQACTKARRHDTAAQVGECARTLLGQRVHNCLRGPCCCCSAKVSTQCYRQHPYLLRSSDPTLTSQQRAACHSVSRLPCSNAG